MNTDLLISDGKKALSEGAELARERVQQFALQREGLYTQNEEFALLIERILPATGFKVNRIDAPIGLNVFVGDVVAVKAHPRVMGGHTAFLTDLELARSALESDGFLHGGPEELLPTIMRYLGMVSAGGRINPNYHSRNPD